MSIPADPATGRNGTRPLGPTGPLAEQSTLAAMLIERLAIEKARAILGPGDFDDPRDQTLFDVITDLEDRGTPVDLVTVKADLEARGALESIGLPYLTGLFDHLPTAANVEYYAKIVKDKATRRHLREFGHRVEQAAGGGIGDTAAFLASAQADLERIAQIKPGVASARRKPLAERMINLRDVPPPPAKLPYLFGPYLNTGASHWLTGGTGVGKSTLLYNILPALAEGRELWGVPCQPCRILYLDMESGDVGRSLKVQRLFHHRSRPDGLLFAREPIRLPEELTGLLDYLKTNKITLVVFDTARRCFTVKDENDNAEVYNRIVPVLDALKAAGVATLTMGHPPKNGGFGARGAGAQEDAGDVNLTLTMHRGEVSDRDGVIKLSVTKNRLLGLSIPPLLLRRVGDDLFESVTAEDAGAPNVPTAQETARQRARQEIVRYLADHPLGSATYSAIMDEMDAVGFTESTAKRALISLKTQEEVKRSTTGVYVLTGRFTPEGSREP